MTLFLNVSAHIVDDTKHDYSQYEAYLGKHIKRGWFPPPLTAVCKTVISFQLAKDGKIAKAQVKESSGNKVMDISAMTSIKTNATPCKPIPIEGVDFVNVEATLESVTEHPKLNSDPGSDSQPSGVPLRPSPGTGSAAIAVPRPEPEQGEET